MTAERTCGACTVCCRALAVAELSKSAGTACSHVARDGCMIYAERPSSCRAFSCLWLLGLGKPSARPDRSGVLLEGQETRLGPTIVVRELVAGALIYAKAQALLKTLRRLGQGLYIRRMNGTVGIEGPPEFVEKAKAIVHLRVLPKAMP